MRMRKSVICVVLLLASCDPGDVVLLAPDGSDASAPTVSIRAVIDTQYATIAASLGWMAGVPGAQVRVHRMDEPYDETYWHVAAADTTGLATFADLLFGLYEVEVTRALLASEAAQSADAERLLAGGRRVYLPASGVHEVTVAPDGRGPLVFSEFKFNQAAYPSETGGVSYPDAKYFEVYNNSDTTIYLDGRYWGMGWDIMISFPAWPCVQTSAVRNDPEGIWAQNVFRFPGAGTDHPLLSGQVALVAKVAIDHRAVHPALFDLSNADFEWGGDADNPDVPNLEDIGLRPMVVTYPGDGHPVFLSEPVDLATLPRYVDPVSGNPWVRIPRALVLDASVGTYDQTSSPGSGGQVTACLEAMHRYFERLPGPASAFDDFYQGLSAQRRILLVRPDGRKELQDTETSMVDFVKAPRTPGWIPDPLP
jgi:hypothetical protein